MADITIAGKLITIAGKLITMREAPPKPCFICGGDTSPYFDMEQHLYCVACLRNQFSGAQLTELDVWLYANV